MVIGFLLISYSAYSTISFNRQVVSVWLTEKFVHHQMRTKYNATTPSNQKIDRRTCCLLTDRAVDICGRPNCTSPLCPPPHTLHELKSDGSNAFFIETSGSGGLNIRQACAVESLAFHNPNLTVNVLFMMDDGHHQKQNKSKVMIKTVEKLREKYENVQFIVADLAEYMTGTSMEKWFHCTDWRTGAYHISHLSDGLRLLTLHQFGGYYFDLDVILVRPVTFYRNFVAAESGSEFGNSVIHADYGHPIMQLAVNDFTSNYK
jgi:lactosylceramide 4-alpha-galactosyltransferase